MESDREKALALVLAERARQDKKWGEQNHGPEWWLAILGEEYGEACQALVQWQFEGAEFYDYLKELVQTAAVALQAVECEIRRKRQGKPL